MKKSLGSFIALNRKPLVLLGIVLSLTVFSFVTWQAGAQINKRGRQGVEPKGGSSSKLDLSGMPESKIKRILADSAANDGTETPADDIIPAAEPVNADETPNGVSFVPHTVIYAYRIANPNDQLISFNPATPGTVTSVDVTGFLNTDEYLESIDFRPFNSQLYGIATDKITSRVVTVNTTTGVIT